MVTDLHEPEKDGGPLRKVFEWIAGVDPSAVKAEVARLRSQRPTASPRGLATSIIRQARTKTTAVGVATGVPANPWVSAGAGVVDARFVIRINASMVAQIGECLVPGFVDTPEWKDEVLLVLLGANAASQMLREAGVLGAMGTTRATVKKVLKGDALKKFRSWALKYFGRKVGQKTVITKTIPFVAILIGGGWNLLETVAIGKRAIAYFEGKELPDE